MNNKLILSLSFLIITSCTAKVFVKKVPDLENPKTIAVLPFKDAPNFPGSGDIATETFSTEILGLDYYQVIDRAALDHILKEQKMNQSGLFDQGQAIEIGKLAGADAIVYGTVTEFQQRRVLMFPPAKVGLTARLINTQTGQVEWSSNHRVGGAKRWLTWIVWPVGVVATAISPSAEDQLANASRGIVKAIRKETDKKLYSTQP